MIRYSRQEFAECLEKGFNWEERCGRIGAAVEEILDDTPADKVLRAGQLTSLILKAYDYKRDRQHPEFKVVSKVITQLGKRPEYKQHISIGKEIRCGNQPDGSPRYARERLWRGAQIRGETQEVLPALGPTDKSSEFTHGAGFISMWMGVRFDELKDYPEQFAVFKEWVKENTGVDMDSVQGVDNPRISKHPSPGATRVDCGECGGSGKVYMKQEPS